MSVTLQLKCLFCVLLCKLLESLLNTFVNPGKIPRHSKVWWHCFTPLCRSWLGRQHAIYHSCSLTCQYTPKEQTSQASMSTHYIISIDSNFINYDQNWWLMVELMSSDETHSGNVQFPIFIFCPSIHLSAGSCKPNTLIYLREREILWCQDRCVSDSPQPQTSCSLWFCKGDFSP